jgi:choice-of-anchor B domain-containing protein
LRYNGPDRRYNGRNICVAYNEDSITVWDSTNKADSKMLGRLEYPGATYTHQGWWTERNWHQFILLNDELDEVEGVVEDGVPITHIIDMSNLNKPKWTGTFKSTDHRAVDHNLYIENGVMFQSNYGAGVWVQDVRSISKYPDGSRVKPTLSSAAHTCFGSRRVVAAMVAKASVASRSKYAVDRRRKRSCPRQASCLSCVKW